MRIGIDDTDSPDGMCTTYLGVYLARQLQREGFHIGGLYLVRLNPNVRYKTRGNAAIRLDTDGDSDLAFHISSEVIEELAELDHERTHPGLVVTENEPDPGFYEQALRDFCTLEEAYGLLNGIKARYRGWKTCRGLIGATAAVCSTFPDATYEFLSYRDHAFRGERIIERESIFDAEDATFPHTWDSVDRENNLVVCVPHTPDPVLFGIRGDSPYWVQEARDRIRSELPVLEQIFCTNQNTDAHLMDGVIGMLNEGRSYSVCGTVITRPSTGRGGHVTFLLGDSPGTVRCMAYEPTKGFRNIVRCLIPGDTIKAVGSYKNASINLEKIEILTLAEHVQRQSPHCDQCGHRMTSAGTGKGYKCRKCGYRRMTPETRHLKRNLKPGWYEVPPSARRHLAKPLIRMSADSSMNTRPERLSVMRENV